jgi:glutamyl-tRNA synthetase
LLIKSKALLLKSIYEEAIEKMSALDDFIEKEIEKSLRELLDKYQCKPRDLFGTIRIAVTGNEVSPPLFITMEILGKKRSIERMKSFIKFISVAT